MDANSNIYREDEDLIPPEDKAKTDGYLTAKAEEGELARIKQQYQEAVDALRLRGK